MEKNKEMIFLSTLITNAINRETGCFDISMTTQINVIAEKIRQKGYALFLAIEQEKWGKELAKPQTCTSRDFNALKEAKGVVVYLTECFSQGTLVEVGWATARGIPVTVICPKGLVMSPLVEGLHLIGDNRIYYVDFEETEQIDAVLDERI